MISETARALRPPRNKRIFSTVLISSWAVRVPGLHSLHFMFFLFRYVKASARYLYKVRLTLQRIGQPPCLFTNPSPSMADSTLRCPQVPTSCSPPQGLCPACLRCLPTWETQAGLSSAPVLRVESHTNTCHPRKCLCHPPFCVRGLGEPADPGPPPFLSPSQEEQGLEMG